MDCLRTSAGWMPLQVIFWPVLYVMARLYLELMNVHEISSWCKLYKVGKLEHCLSPKLTCKCWTICHSYICHYKCKCLLIAYECPFSIKDQTVLLSLYQTYSKWRVCVFKLKALLLLLNCKYSLSTPIVSYMTKIHIIYSKKLNNKNLPLR